MDLNSRQADGGQAAKGPSSGRAVASDFDNTLYFMGDEEPMRAADIFGIVYFQQRGGLFGLCTGRSLVGVRDVIGSRIRPDFYILATGALVLDGEENVLFRKCLPLDLVKSIYHRVPAPMHSVIQANDTVYTLEEENYLQTHIDSLDDLKDAYVYGLSIAAQDVQSAADLAEQINGLYGEEVTAFHNVTHVDVAPRGCSKGTGIEVVRKAFSIREMYGIGCKEYIEKVRISKVEHYLLFTDYDLRYISRETGYADCSHMIKDFRRLMGTTPGQFRQERKKT